MRCGAGDILRYTAWGDGEGRSAAWCGAVRGKSGMTGQNERQSLQVSPARPSDGSSIKLKTLSNGRRIMIYWEII